jgi:hypothetical protein
VHDFAAWSRTRVAGGVLLAHPAGNHRGLVRIRRRGSAAPMRQVIAEVLAASPARLAAATCERVCRLVTDEGEHAAIATLRSHFAGGGYLDRHVALVAGDGTAIQIEGFASGPGDELERDIEALVRRAVTGAAAVRRRMFEYRPPPDWRGMRRASSTLWLPPGCPREPGSIEVHDAVPLGDRGAELTHALLCVASPERGEPLAVGSLAGTVSPARASLAGARFRYQVDLDDPGRRHRAVFDAVIGSIRPIPAAATAAADAAGPFDWVS